MRRRNLVIAVVTGLGMLGAAFALALSPPTSEVEAQADFRDLTVDTVTFAGIRDDSTLTPNSGVSILSVQGSLNGAPSGINIEFDDTDEVNRWKINKCYSMANKALVKPGKYRVTLLCNDGCTLPTFIDCRISPL